MKISKRIFVTLICATGLVGILVVGYFVLLLPGLFVDFMEHKYFQQTVNFHRLMASDTLTLDNANTQSNLQVVGLVIPDTGYTIQVFSPYLKFNATIEDAELRSLMDIISTIEIQSDLDDISSILDDYDFESLQDRLVEQSPIDLFSIHQFELASEFSATAISSYSITSDDIIVLKDQVSFNHTSYSNLIAISQVDNTLYATFSSVTTPEISELFPIVLNSVPMIIAILLLVTIVGSITLSRFLGRPVEILATQARNHHFDGHQVFKQPNRGDEFETLENALNQMSTDLNRSLVVLSSQYQSLEHEKKRQTLFLTNASHQLKTPISSASLLVQSMMDGIGQYRDPYVTLPLVLTELKKMNAIVHDSLNQVQSKQATPYTPYKLKEEIQGMLLFYKPTITNKKLKINLDLEHEEITTDPHLFSPCLENILSNALKFTPENHNIWITEKDYQLRITSESTHIDETILPFVKDPFVRQANTRETGTGLGLYLVDTFMHLLNRAWSIENHDHGVCVTFYLEEDHANNQ